MGLQNCDRLGNRMLSHPVLHELINLGAVFDPVRQVGVAGVVLEVFPADGPQTVLPAAGGDGAYRHVAVRGVVDVERRPADMRVAAPDRDFSGVEVFDQLGQEEEGPVLHRDIDPLAPAGFVAQLEGRQDADDPEQGRRGIADGRPAADRLAVGKTGHAVNPAHGLNDRIVGPPFAVRAGLTKTRDGAHNEPWVDRLQGGKAQAHLVQGAGRVILDHDIGLAAQLLEQLDALSRAQVERHALFVASPMQDHQADIVVGLLAQAGALGTGVGRTVAVAFALARRFDFYDLGAQAAQQQGAVRTGQKTGQVEDA